MDSKRWALFFCFLFCCDHIGNAAASVPVVKPPGGIKRGCQISARLEYSIDQCLEKYKVIVKDTYQVEDQPCQQFYCRDGSISGCRNIKRVSYSCICYRDFIRIFLKVSLIDVVLTFVLSLRGILNGLLSGVILALVRLLKSVTNLLVRLLSLRIDIIIVIDQRFDGGPCYIRDVRVDRFGEVGLLGLQLGPLLNKLLIDLLRPLLQSILSALLSGEFKAALIKAFQGLIIQNKYHNCATPY